MIENMEYTVSQYSLIETWIMWQYEARILRPDGSLLIEFGFNDFENAHAAVDELNSLLVLPDHHPSTLYDELDKIPRCNQCHRLKDSVRFQDKYTGYECADCQPF